MKFSQRHIGISSSDEKYMLDFLGIDKIDTLIGQTIPDDNKSKFVADFISAWTKVMNLDRFDLD